MEHQSRASQPERDYDEGISSSNSDDISIYSFTDCESESDDEDHERRTPPLKVKDEEDGKVTRLEVRDMVEDDDLSLHSFDESDFLRDDGNDASAEDSPEPPKEPQRKVASLKDPQLIIVAKPNIPLPASVSALKKVSRQMEVVPTVRPCRQQLDKKTQWTNTNEESLRRIFKNLASMELDLEEGLQTVNDGLDINQVRQKNEGCFRAWIEKWMGRRKEKNPKDEEMDREDKGKMGEELRALIQVMRRNCSESDLEAVDLDRWLNDLERLKVAFKKCTGKICEMVEFMVEMQTRIAENRPEKKNYVRSFSPGKVSGPVSGQTGLSPLVTSAPWTLAEALQALPSAVAPLSPEDVPRPRTPPSPVPVIVSPSAVCHTLALGLYMLSQDDRDTVEYFPHPRLALIINLRENSRKLLQDMAQKMPRVAQQDVEAKRIGKGKKKAKKGRRKPVIDSRRKMLRKVRKGCEKGQKESEEEVPPVAAV
ncbi:hypothetical protein J4Q44_G00126350 [Coregonus suidteri]|uniref:Uncharacterized protein n=1 Tax=Coregonus suidteri TaxID=861788 RepID=A0AAN8LRA5_9TELE